MTKWCSKTTNHVCPARLRQNYFNSFNNCPISSFSFPYSECLTFLLLSIIFSQKYFLNTGHKLNDFQTHLFKIKNFPSITKYFSFFSKRLSLSNNRWSMRNLGFILFLSDSCTLFFSMNNRECDCLFVETDGTN